MNLAEPTIGDIVDRLSILSLKGSGDPAVVKEAAALERRLWKKLGERHTGTIPAGTVAWLIRHAVALGAVNGRLWEVHEQPENHSLPYAVALNQLRRTLTQVLE